MELRLEIICPAKFPGTQRAVEAIPILADQGVTAVEVSVEFNNYFDHHDPDEVHRLISVLSSSGVRVQSVHGAFGRSYDISSPDDQIHEQGVDGLIESIELASLLDAERVIVHASDFFENNRERRFDRAHGVLKELSAVASEAGIVIALENLIPKFLGYDPDELLALLEGIDPGAIGICFDTGHANLSGRFEEYAETLLPYAVEIHLHDNDGTQDQHKFPGNGTINWPRFAALLRESGSMASMMIECQPPEGIPWSKAFQMFRAQLGE